METIITMLIFIFVIMFYESNGSRKGYKYLIYLFAIPLYLLIVLLPFIV